MINLNRNTFDRNTVDHITRYGWSGIYVSAEPVFEYTIGLTSLSLPELIVFGLPFESSHQILRCAIDVVRSKGRPSDKQVSTEILRDRPAVFCALPQELTNEQYTCQAQVFYEPQPVEVMQIVWPDRTGMFPWNYGCDPGIAAAQSEIVSWVSNRLH